MATKISIPKLKDEAASPAVEMPKLELPTLEYSEGASMENQLTRLNSLDSVGMQQAKVKAQEQLVPSGGIHSSQAAGAAQRAVTDSNSILAGAEAQKVAAQDNSNFQNLTQSALETYEKNYTERLDQMGYSEDRKLAMSNYASAMSNSFLSSMTSLINNTDLDLQQGAINKLTTIFNRAMDNNNLILDMGFTY